MRQISVCLLLAGLTHAVQVYLNPNPQLPSHIPPERASFVVSYHLGLDIFEPLGNTRGYHLLDEQQFVGQGPKNGLLLTVDESDAKSMYAHEDCQLHGLLKTRTTLGILPTSMNPSFSIPNTPSLTSPSSLISTYLHRARHVYSSIYTSLSYPRQDTPRTLDLFSISSPSTDTFLAELTVISDFLDANPSSFDQFAALELTGLSKIAAAFGRTSDQYLLAAQATRATLESALSQNNLHLVLLSFDPLVEPQNTNEKRAPQPPKQSPLPSLTPSPQQPNGGISTCFETADACSNSTGDCSGRGQCLEATKAGRTCFICACNTITTDKGKKETWVGEACEKKDVSG
jgi:hypothetical protein